MKHTLYGCSIDAERTLPIRQTAFAESTHVDLRFDAPPHPSGQIVYRGDHVTLWRTEVGHHFKYADETEFLISPAGDQVTASTPPGATLEDTCTYLLGPIMRLVLRLKGVVSLHASTVVIGDRAVALCGPPGAGKSTTAAALAQRGYAVLAEDVAALDDRRDSFHVQPGYPRVNLWPESAAALCGSADALPAITPNWGKRYLPLDNGGPTFHSSPAPLAAIYVLGERRQQPNPTFQSLQSVEALIALASNTYTPYLLDEAMRAREFDVLTRLVKHIPVRRVLPPANIADIGRFCDGLLEDYDSLS